MIVFRPWNPADPPAARPAGMGWEPAADVVVGEQSIHLVIELAGVPREAIEVIADGRRLEVRGERARVEPAPGGRYRQAELAYGPFRRVFEFAFDLEQADISARSADGLLQLAVRPPGEARRAIAIDATD